MYAFDNPDTVNPVRECVYSCPYPWVSDTTNDKCHLACTNAGLPYLDKAAKQCVSTCTSPVYQYAYLPVGQSTNG